MLLWPRPERGEIFKISVHSVSLQSKREWIIYAVFLSRIICLKIEEIYSFLWIIDKLDKLESDLCIKILIQTASDVIYYSRIYPCPVFWKVFCIPGQLLVNLILLYCDICYEICLI